MITEDENSDENYPTSSYLLQETTNFSYSVDPKHLAFTNTLRKRLNLLANDYSFKLWKPTFSFKLEESLKDESSSIKTWFETKCKTNISNRNERVVHIEADKKNGKLPIDNFFIFVEPYDEERDRYQEQMFSSIQALSMNIFKPTGPAIKTEVDPIEKIPSSVLYTNMKPQPRVKKEFKKIDLRRQTVKKALPDPELVESEFYQKHSYKKPKPEVQKQEYTRRGKRRKRQEFVTHDIDLPTITYIKSRKKPKKDPMSYYVGDDMWEVEDIVAQQKRFGIMYYLVKWKGFHHKDNTWETEDHLEGCSQLLLQFKKKQQLEEKKKKKSTAPKPSNVREEYLQTIESFGEDILNSIKMYNKRDILDPTNNTLSIHQLDSDTLRALFIRHAHRLVSTYKKFKNEIHKFSVMPTEENFKTGNVHSKNPKDIDTTLDLEKVYFSVNVKKACISEMARQIQNLQYLDELKRPSTQLISENSFNYPFLDTMEEIDFEPVGTSIQSGSTQTDNIEKITPLNDKSTEHPTTQEETNVPEVKVQEFLR